MLSDFFRFLLKGMENIDRFFKFSDVYHPKLAPVWNGKAIHQGGGGYDGNLVQPDKQPTLTDPTTDSPMMRGYVTFASDGGHQNPPGTWIDGSFALNEEAFANYAGDELKKTHDVAMKIIEKYFDAKPTRTYFIGFSEGGREALYVTQHFPKDYDGVIAGAPVYSLTLEEIANIVMFQNHYAPGGLMNAAKMTTLKNAVLEACDSLDNLEDGIISAPELCNFDPATLACPSGEDNDDCLTPEQITTVNAIGSPVTLDFKVANGQDTYGGYPILKGSQINFGTRAEPGIPPVFGLDPGLWAFGDIAVRWFIVQDTGADLRDYDPNDYKKQTRKISKIVDATSTNLSLFRAHGGKLIITHGAVDQYVSPYTTSMYYKRLVHKYGQEVLDTFVRYYVIPGYDHGMGAPFKAGWDDIGALDSWVENGTAPSNPVVNDVTGGSVVRSRPLCEYPMYPRYVSGDENVASSFICAEYAE